MNIIDKTGKSNAKLALGWCIENIGEITLPLWQQAIDWLREKHDIDIELPYGGNKDKYYVFVQEYIYEGKDPKQFTYYGAREQAILKAIEIIKSA